MLYYAAHVDEEPEASAESAKTNPDLADYVEAWGQRCGDLGFIALSSQAEPVGAAWIRMMPSSSPLYKHVSPDTPELAIGVEPAHRCAGAHQARLELRLMLLELLNRIDQIELTGKVQRLKSNVVAGIKHMPVHFTQRSVAA
jgi:hypothetical protein